MKKSIIAILLSLCYVTAAIANKPEIQEKIEQIQQVEVQQITDSLGNEYIKVILKSSNFNDFKNLSSLKSTNSTQIIIPLQRLSNILNEYPETSISVYGHTDKTGSYQTNINVSERRANAVATYLQKCGVNSNRFTEIKGLGYSQYDITRNAHDNRRVELIISIPHSFDATAIKPEFVEQPLEYQPNDTIVTEDNIEIKFGKEGSSSWGFRFMYTMPAKNADTIYGLNFDVYRMFYFLDNFYMEQGIGFNYSGAFEEDYYSQFAIKATLANVGASLDITDNTAINIYTGVLMNFIAYQSLLGKKVEFSRISYNPGFQWCFGTYLRIGGKSSGILFEYQIDIHKNPGHTLAVGLRVGF